MKKTGFLTLLIMATLLFVVALAFPAAAAGPKAPVPAAPAVVPVPTAAPAPVPPHPHIHEALEAMRAARGHLQRAVPEFEGHRAKAMEHLDQAIREAEICEGMR
ncbi:MAG TPA: hypothetical protein VHW45_01095 [Candidatus Sulfotelmatobacter sp.]|nr:hypothetical protein [Candidatus Sulfotelmatobacter sp.]